MDKPLILGGIGVAWVLYGCKRTTNRYTQLLDGIREVIIEESRNAFDLIRKQALQSMANTRRLTVFSTVLYVIILGSSVFAWNGWARQSWLEFIYVLPSPWYTSPGVSWRIVSVSLMAFPVTFVLCSSGQLFFLHLRMVCGLQKLYFVHSPITSLNHVQPFLRLSIVSALMWSFGVCLLVILPDLLAPGLLLLFASLAGFGAAGFMLPLLVFRRKLVELQNERREIITRFIIDAMQGQTKDKASMMEIISLEEKFDAGQQGGTLLIELRYAAWIFVSFILPVAVNLAADKLSPLLPSLK